MWQIRKDFSYFGEFGKRVVGYNIGTLTEQIRKILRLEEGPKAALIGVGDLGMALLAYPGFTVYGFRSLRLLTMTRKKLEKKVNNAICKADLALVLKSGVFGQTDCFHILSEFED